MSATATVRKTTRLRALATAIGLGYHSGRSRFVLTSLLQVFSSVTMVFSTWVLSRFIASLAAQSWDDARLYAVLIALATGGLMTYVAVWRLDLRFRTEVETTGYVEQELIGLSTDLVGIEHHEREDYVAEVELLRESRGSLGNASAALLENLGSIVGLVSTVGLLASVHPALWLLPLAGVPIVWASAANAKKQQALHESTASVYRQIAHLDDLCTQPAPAKEVRVFGLGTLLRVRSLRLSVDTDDRWRKRLTAQGALESVAWAVFGTAYVGAIWFVVDGAVRGRHSLADVILVISLAASVADRVSFVVDMARWLVETLVVVGRYRWLRDEVERLAAGPSTGAPVPTRLTTGIEIDGVDFTYPGTDTPVLRNISLDLPAGSTVAIVGDNGAGKSTLVKLLTQMYEPTAGRILVDGRDLAEFDVDEWRRATSAGFQDHCRYELTAQRAVGLGHLPDLDNPAAAADALHRAASAGVIDQLEDGLDTKLGRAFDLGRELSGGQWQKLALGRAMMRREPLLLVLDEPTSALDAETEHELFTQYAVAAREVAGRTGGITVLVSHRFSTVRMADLIVVLDGNTLAEVGPHDQLVERGGLYAELYELQARAYR